MNKLILHTGYHTGYREEIWQELCMLWFKNFEDKYETDRQYLSFLFICLKNRIRNMQKKQYTHEHRFTTGLGFIRSSLKITGSAESEGAQEVEYNAVWGQVKNPSSCWDEYEINELVQNYRKMLDQAGNQVLDAMLTESRLAAEVDELAELESKEYFTYLTPSEKRRKNILQNKSYIEGLDMSEVVTIVKLQIRPLFEGRKISCSL
jgi:DNA-directed RNA polymerase specialized sigma24 family protein